MQLRAHSIVFGMDYYNYILNVSRVALPINPMPPSHTRDQIVRFTKLQIFAHNHAHTCQNGCLHVDNGPNQERVAGGSDSSAIRYYTQTNAAQTKIEIPDGYRPRKSDKSSI